MQSRGPAWLWLAVAAAGLIGLLAALSGRFPGALDDQDSFARLIYLLAWVALAGSGLVLAIRREPLTQLRNLAIWVGIGLALFIGYSFKDDLGPRLLGQLMPQRGVAGADGAVSFRVGQDGHYHVEARVNGSLLRLLVDTGASTVILSPADARRVGFDLDSLTFTGLAETANGRVRIAPVTLREVDVGGVRLDQVAASVNEAAMGESLLGMSFLERLSSYTFSGDTLILRP